MTVHLDANLLVAASDEKSEFGGVLLKWLEGENRLAASAIAWSEFCNGPVELVRKALVYDLLERTVVDFNREMAELASDLFNATGRRRGSHSDCMIAACAIKTNVPISTLNLQDFERFEPHGLKLHTF